MLYTVETSRPSRPVDPVVSRYRHPVAFYLLATAIPWGLWFTAGYLSRLPHQPPALTAFVAVLGVSGLVAPLVVAAVLVARDPVLLRDVLHRLVNVHEVRPWAVLLAVFLLPVALLLATAISIPLGYPLEQFGLRGGFSFASGVMPVLLVLVLAPVLEELAWHSYGTDALVSRWSVWRSSLIFAVIWTMWHIPLGTIQGYYQAEVVETGWLATLNFGLSLFPFIILMNWLYYRSGRNIAIAIVFHLSANLGNEIFLTHPDTKAIQTGVLLVVCAVVLWRERALFFTRPERVVAITHTEEALA